MCGVGALFSAQAGLSAGLMKAMMDLVRHRGPDDEGWVGFSGHERKTEARSRFSALLGHRRLSILDLSSHGHQPMRTEDGRYWIVHNGEVYNFLELRQELEREGDTFFSGTDTEVILKAYRRWGPDALSRFNGMFAFVIFDTLIQRVFAARDRFNVKPLYYWFSPLGFMAIASEIKQFLPLPGWEGKLNGQRAYDFLNWGLTDHEADCLFEGVFHLKGGHYLEFSLGERARVHRWYHPPEQSFKGTMQEAALEFRRLLQDSVQLRLRADVDVGSCLSGGLDSSAIVCLVHELRQNQRQCAFSACTENKALDERPFIEAVVSRTNVEPYAVFPSPERLLEILDDIIWYQDEPFGSTSIFAQWTVFELVRQQGIKVMLDGQGADEQLAGYHKFFAYRLQDLWTNRQWRQFAEELRACRRLHRMGWPVLFRQLCPLWLRAPMRRLLGRSEDWLDLSRLGAEAKDPLEQEQRCSLGELCAHQLRRSNLPMLLRYEDRDSMAHSVESRTPFLDYRLVEFCLSLPDDFKLAGAVTKKVLRESLEGVLPEMVRCRYDKIGFALPEEVWMKQQPKRFEAECRHAVDRLHGAVKPSALRDVRERLEGRRPFSQQIWRLICLGRWMERFHIQSNG